MAVTVAVAVAVAVAVTVAVAVAVTVTVTVAVAVAVTVAVASPTFGAVGLSPGALPRNDAPRARAVCRARASVFQRAALSLRVDARPGRRAPPPLPAWAGSWGSTDDRQRRTRTMFVSYEVSLDLISGLRGVLERMKEHDAELAAQMRDAAASITLNLGEGAGCSGGRRRQHYEIAHGSAREVKAALDVGERWGWLDASGVRAVMDRLLGLLWGLTKGKWTKTRAGVPVARAA